MADTSGMAEIRGINIDKLAKGFADEDIVFKKHVAQAPTNAREMRWYKKTTGILDSTDTSGMTSSRIEGVAPLAIPESVEQSWTRQTSYVKKYIVDSPSLAVEDVKDSDPDVLATNIRDLTRAIARKVDGRIWDVLTESRVRTGQLINFRATSGSWSTGGSAYPIHDILQAKKEIRSQGYDPEGGTLFLNSTGHLYLLRWLINVKGANIPQFSSARMGDGVVHNLLGLNVVVSEHVTADYGAVAQGKVACTYKQFMPITATTIEDPGVGIKIRVWEQGEAILPNPKAVCLLSGTGT